MPDPQKPKTDNISYRPSAGLCYDPAVPLYWDERALGLEIERTFEICHGCRMCFKYCDVFPNLFSLIDRDHQGDVRGLTAGERDGVLSACFQCKLCEVQCPYTPREGHEFQLDFPRLAHRFRAQKARWEGVSLRDRLLARPDLAGRLARLSFGMANWMNRFRPHRVLLEWVLGIHRDKLLPEFAATTFSRWARATGRSRRREPGGEAVLFPTCYIENNEPQIGRDTVEVLEKNQVDLRLVEGQVCCGMPAWEKGDLDAVRAQARINLGVLLPFVEKGAKVIAINPTCSMMLRRELPELVAVEDRAQARKLAAAVADPGEFLWSLRDQPRFVAAFESSPGEKVAYHAPCHLRAQGVGFRGRDLLRRIPGVTAVTVMECCGHDGTYAMTKEGFAPSCRIGKKAFDGMKEAEASCWVTDCPLAAVQFEQHAGKKPLHPMSVLARAYRRDGFADQGGRA